MNSKNLKSLNESIAKVASPVDEKNVARGFINSLSGKALQIHEEEKKETAAHEKAEGSNHETSEIMKKLAAKALKRAKKKAATNEEIELAEKAAPGYEDWASDPKVKASFKKQYGKRWKQVMYAKSWKMSKMDEETQQLDELTDTLLFRARAKAKALGKFNVRKKGIAGTEKDRPLANKISDELRRRGAIQEETLDEGFQAQRMRVIRKEIGKREPTTGAKAEFLKKTYKRKLARNKALEAKYPEMSKKYGGGQQGNMLLRAALRKKAMDKKGMSTKGLSEETILEAMQAKLNRAKGKAYKMGILGKPREHSKAYRYAAELEDKVAAMKARRGGASPEAVKAAGNIRGKSGVPTQKGMRLADQRRKAISRFKSREGYGKAQGMSRSSTGRQISRNVQQFQDDMRNKARSGDFGQDNQTALRARYNYEKKYGRLKGK